MAKDPTKKINIADNLEEGEGKGEIEVKKSQRMNALEERQNKTEKVISDFYQDKEFSFQGPDHSHKGLIWLMIIWSIAFGLIAGTVASFFVLTRETITIPFINKEIKLAGILPTKEVGSVTEKNVTVLAETRMEDLINNFSGKIVKIFKAKTKEQVNFLEQIYAPWQTLGLGAFISSDGWLITAYNFEPEVEYVILDGENKIIPVDKIINDPVTGLSFCKINKENVSAFELEKKEEIISGQQAVILDKLQNVNLTVISRPLARNIFKTEDLVYSTDKFSEFLRLNVSETAFPQSLIFGLNGKLLGLISLQRSIPAWQIQPLINQIIATQEIKRPFLGFDYLRIDQVPGLTSPLFKDLTKGLIVYGSPIENSPASKSGIKNADIIVKVNDQVLDKDGDLTYLVLRKIPGDEIGITVLRDGKEVVLKIILEEQKD